MHSLQSSTPSFKISLVNQTAAAPALDDRITKASGTEQTGSDEVVYPTPPPSSSHREGHQEYKDDSKKAESKCIDENIISPRYSDASEQQISLKWTFPNESETGKAAVEVAEVRQSWSLSSRNSEDLSRVSRAMLFGIPAPLSYLKDAVSSLLISLRLRKMSLKDFRMGEIVGIGGQSIVQKARPLPSSGLWMTSGGAVVLRTAFRDKNNKKEQNQLKLTLRIHQKLRGHPNIVECFGIVEETDNAYFVLEELQGGDIQHLLRNQLARTERVAKIVGISVLKALCALHREGFAHRDIKPENIMLAKKWSPLSLVPPSLKLIDFGLACSWNPSSPYTAVSRAKCGTWGFSAPEMFTDASYRVQRADIFSLGATMYFLIAGCSPMQALDGFKVGLEVSFTKRLRDKPVSFRANVWKSVSSSIKKFIFDCTHCRPYKRPTAEEALSRLKDLFDS